MRCPYCTIAMRPVPAAIRGRSSMFYNDGHGGHHTVEAVACPECEGIFLTHSDMTITDGPEPGQRHRVGRDARDACPHRRSGARRGGMLVVPA